jgi:predicted nuclease of restriction endonuclease-like (RecB) superfamily
VEVGVRKRRSEIVTDGYKDLLKDVSTMLEAGRRGAARSVNTIMVVTYWHVGRRIVEYEQGGRKRAEYGKAVLRQLSIDLVSRFGRGFSERNLLQMRAFYQQWPIPQTLSAESDSREGNLLISLSNLICQPVAAESAPPFSLPWSHYVRLLSLKKQEARKFYEQEAIRGGWSIRQLERQIGSLFYERTLLSRKKVAMLKKGHKKIAADLVLPEEEIKDPYVLEFLDLKDEYSESDIEEGLIISLEEFLLELGSDFTFVGRQKRLRVSDEWYRVDLVFFHRRLKCLVIIDLKLDKLTAADVGQMHLYLNYARAHWTHPDENPPVGLILGASKDSSLAKYALEGLNNKVLAAEYRMALPDEKVLAAALEKSRQIFEREKKLKPDRPN